MMQEPHIIYQDQDILVINKPSGMTVNKADTTKNEITVQDWAEKELKSIPDSTRMGLSISDNQKFRKSDIQTNRVLSESNLKKEYNIEDEFYSRRGIVHRLDKETSGSLLIAKNPESFGKLKEQFMNRTIEKSYIALAHGDIRPTEGEINAPVGRLPFNRTHFGVVAGGREAVTKYKVLNIKYLVSNRRKEPLSLVQLWPKTGRTHQIRVHLKHMNHPIFGDELYAGRKAARDDRRLLLRLFLHAAEITFTHPTTGQTMHLKAPLPQELEQFLTDLEPLLSERN